MNEKRLKSMAHKIFENHYKVAFFSTLAVSLVLLIVSFILPPSGQIDPSVCRAVSEVFLWPLLAFGAKALEVYYENKNKNKKK
jgi:hypothetical protein